MVIAFQIILLVVIALSLLGVMGGQEKERITSMSLVCIAEIAAFVAIALLA